MVSRGSASPHGFAVVRGRGYRPKQVDQRLVALARERDGAWERAARLTVLVREMEAEAERLRAAVARLAPQTYESLGARARQLLALSQEEALVVRAGAQEEARQLTEAAEHEAREVREAARAYAETLRAEADERAGERVSADRASAEELRTAAGDDAQETRAASLALLREMRERVTGLLAEQEREQGERWAAAERQIAERAAHLKDHYTELAVAAQAGLRDAQLTYAKAQEAAGHAQEDAEAYAAELLSEARMRKERIGRATDRQLDEHRAQWEAMRSELGRLLGGLKTLPVCDTPPEEPS